MIEVKIETPITDACPHMHVGLIRATVANSPTSDALWQEMTEHANKIKETYQLLGINQRPAIAATRALYRKLGKDPSRYRIASEALCRRIIRGLGLYKVSTLADITNLVSFVSGYPISGLDADKIDGNTLTMGVGRAGEPYCGIGRGSLNIENMPVYRDAQGGVASPTSDEERTKFTPATTHVQICVNAFAPEMPLEQAVNWTVQLLEKYAQATAVETSII